MYPYLAALAALAVVVAWELWLRARERRRRRECAQRFVDALTKTFRPGE